ncbi:hypothetical protein [Streptomyces enissocaesilis]|uniref:Tannase/feruloyl esterase family alpha/beta hydrolase n=1 Tax=Streptomyces enissocaesilis TaxID=332589 RepID=A0ABN3X876_9ACTN
MYAAGYPAGSEPLWDFHYRNQGDSLQHIVREEVDPRYESDKEAGTPFCPQGTQKGCATDYVYADRPADVHKVVKNLSLTGRIKRPLISLQGTLDVLLPISRSGDVCAKMVADTRHGDMHRYYRVTGGTHSDGLYAARPEPVRPMSPCLRTAFDALTAWTGQGTTPPPSRTLPAPPGRKRHRRYLLAAVHRQPTARP